MTYIFVVIGVVIVLWVFSKPSRAKQINDSLEQINQSASTMNSRVSEWTERRIEVNRLELPDLEHQARHRAARRRVERQEEHDDWLAADPRRKTLFEKAMAELVARREPATPSDRCDSGQQNKSTETNKTALPDPPRGTAKPDETKPSPSPEIRAWAQQEYEQRKAEKALELEGWLSAKPHRRERFVEALKEIEGKG